MLAWQQTEPSMPINIPIVYQFQLIFETLTAKEFSRGSNHLTVHDPISDEGLPRWISMDVVTEHIKEANPKITKMWVNIYIYICMSFQNNSSII